jgi:hypothetical protein
LRAVHLGPLQHDEEMVTIRPALLDKFGVMPVIDMFRQAAVRCQKARDWQAVRDGAQRGISVYGDDAARPEARVDPGLRAAASSL